MGTDTFSFALGDGDEGDGAGTSVELGGGCMDGCVLTFGCVTALGCAGGNGFPLDKEDSKASLLVTLELRERLAGLAFTGGGGLLAVIPTAFCKF